MELDCVCVCVHGKVSKNCISNPHHFNLSLHCTELLITSGGENIAPVPIENAIKTELPFLSNVFLVGDKKKYLTCLVTLQTEVDPETGDPKDELTVHAKNMLEQLGSSSASVSEVLGTHDVAVNEAIRDGIQRANKHATSNAQRVSEH